ncbi:MAG: anti-sigma factor family protein [Candidatus Sulfotelmatobacter sp.]
MVENKINCEKVWAEISNYIDGEVDPALRPALDEHFKTCVRCTSVLAGTRNVVKLYGDERLLEVPAGFSRRLEKRLAKNVAGTVRRWPTLATWLVPVAAMALIAVGVMLTNSLSIRHYIQSRHAQPGDNIPPDLTVVVESGSKLFHIKGCPFIHDPASERTMTAKEAKSEGYVPCTRCLRQYLRTGLIGPHEDDANAGGEDGDDHDGEVHVNAASAAAP